MTEGHQSRRPRLQRYDVATLRDIRPAHLAASLLLGAVAVVLATTSAYARTDSATATSAPNAEDGPNLVVNTVAAALVALLLVGGFFAVRYARATYRSKS